MNTNMGKGENSINEAISEALIKLNKKEPQKDGVDLVSITKKLSEKKFGKK